MASLLDFLGQGGLLGNLGGGSFYNGPQEAEGARTAAAAQLAHIMGRRQPAPVTPMGAQDPAIGQQDPFNFMMPGMTAQGGAPQQQPPAAAPPPLAPPTQVPPPGAMPVNLPTSQPAPQMPAAALTAAPTARPSFMGGLNNFIDNNRATLMSLAGGIAGHGVAGFGQAAPVMMAERQFQQQQQSQAFAANAIHQGLIAKGHNPKEATAIAMSAATNPAVAAAILPELFGNKPSGTFKFGDTEIPYKIENGQARVLLPGGSTQSLADFIKFGQGVSAQGAAAKTGAETTAKAQAEAGQALPDVLASSDATLKEIEAIKNHPGKGLATGPVLGAMPAIGGQQADYIARLDQLKGAATQMAIQANKGGGMRLTNAEVMSLQKVAARLDRRADVAAALNDFADVVKGARERAGIKAGQGPTPAPAAPAANGGWSVTRVN
jgi:hypothetical protein